MTYSVSLLMCLLTFIGANAKIVSIPGGVGTGACPQVDMQPSYFIKHNWPEPIDMNKADGVIYPNGRTYSNITLQTTNLFPRNGDLGTQYVYSASNEKSRTSNVAFISNYSYYGNPFGDGIVIRIGQNSNKTGSVIVGTAQTTIKKIYPALMLGSSFGNFSVNNKSGAYFNHTLLILPSKCGTVFQVAYCLLQPRTDSYCPGNANYVSYALIDSPTDCTSADESKRRNGLEDIKKYFNLVNCTYFEEFNVTADERAEWFGITQDSQGVHLYTSRKNGFNSNNLFLFASVPIYDKINYYTVIPRSIITPANQRSAWAAFYVYPLHQLSYLLNFDVNGYITQAADCGYNDYTQLVCSYGDFNMKSGVYSTSYYSAKPVGAYYEAHVYPDCNFTDLFRENAPTIMQYKRQVFTRCNYNLTLLLSLVQVDEFVCDKITPEALATGCYSSLTVDWFAFPYAWKSYLAIGSADRIVRFNYNQDYSNPSCRIHSKVNSSVGISYSGLYSYITNCNYGGFNKDDVVKPGGRASQPCVTGALNSPTNGQVWSFNFGGVPYRTSRLTYTDHLKNPLDMVYVITVKYEPGAETVCPKQVRPDYSTNITGLLGSCISYDIYGITGTGVFQLCNATGIPQQKFVYDKFDNIIGFHSDDGNYYCVAPCVSVPVSVIYDDNTNQYATLFGSVACQHISTMAAQFSRETRASLVSRNMQNLLQTSVGCVMGFHETNDTVEDCNLSLGQSLCAIPPNTNLRVGRSTFGLGSLAYNSPLRVDALNSSEFKVSLPLNFTFGVTQEYIETSIQKITVDCKQYVCNGFAKCEKLLEQYGQFCSKINQALHGANLRQDDFVRNLFESVKTPQTVPLTTGFGGEFNLTLLEPLSVSTGSSNARSALEELLFDKVTIADPGYMQGYDDCMQQGPASARDLICAQYVAGYKVLPPLMDVNMEAAYTSSLLGSIAGAGWTAGLSSFAAIPFAQSIFYRLNGVGITQQVLSENQKIIANKFNQALGAMQTGFTTTNEAFQKVQDAVNTNAQALAKLASELSNTFGAISSSIGDIIQRLDVLEQEVQIDRLINGRLTTLNAFVAQQLVRSESAARSAQLAKDKVNECVKSQSTRSGFCGQGTHIVSFVINAPNGLYFMHVGYHPSQHIEVVAAYGLCDAANPTNCIAPVNGYFIKNQTTRGVDDWSYTGSSFYAPEPITTLNTRYVAPQVTFQNISTNLPPPLLGNSTGTDFKDELDEFFKNVSTSIPNFGALTQINTTLLDLSDEMLALQQVVKALNESYIDLKELGNYTYYNKWPWYIWLGFIAGLLALALCVFFILCCTGCGTSCLGKLKCNRCCDKYEEYDLEPHKIHIH
ncbi:spike protein [Bat coronavirus]|uniref:Spike glycoprotein n=1 Tax=Bat coronavirus TaxID=1508220 RepID=A0ACD6B8Z6_9NIDO|nr:spike protein [Bat coronavirus]ARJ34226.1 spike glycoprotein [Bat coronavirus]